MNALKLSKEQQKTLKATAGEFAQNPDRRNAQLLAMELVGLFRAEGYIAEPGDVAHLPENGAGVVIFHGDQPSPRRPEDALAVVRVGNFSRFFRPEPSFEVSVNTGLHTYLGSRFKDFQYKASAFEPKKLAAACLPALAKASAWQALKITRENVREATAREALKTINGHLRHYGLAADILLASEFRALTRGAFTTSRSAYDESPVSLENSYIFRVSRGGLGERFVVVGACAPEAEKLTSSLYQVGEITEAGIVCGESVIQERYAYSPSVLTELATQQGKDGNLALAIAEIFGLVMKHSGALSREWPQA